MASETKKHPLYRNFFVVARHYSKGAQLLFGNLFEGKKDGDYIPSGILCSTFCIELLLKSLILIRYDDVFTASDVKRKQIRINKHSYLKLFRMIAKPIRERIVCKYNDLFGDNLFEADFESLLGSLGENNFIEWRYVFEAGSSKHLDIQLQNRITDSLGKCIEDLLREKGQS